jgi:Cof subfamily protein (haloacid dehalogenase superfamily)
MAIKLIAFDMDDTLLLDDRTIGRRTMEALRAAHARGVKIVPATGRGKHSMWKYVEEIGAADAAICTNGAQVYDGTGKSILENPVPLDAARRVARFAKENGWYLQGYSAEDYFFAQETEETRLYARLAGHMGQEVGDLEDYLRLPPYKLLFVETDMERMKRLKEAAIPLFGKELNLFVSKPFYLEITSPEATKGNAVLKLAARFDLLPGETMCFGDSGNDLSMIDCAGVGVVMGNAADEIKAHADLIAPTNQEEGVAQVIEQYVLQGATI